MKNTLCNVVSRSRRPRIFAMVFVAAMSLCGAFAPMPAAASVSPALPAARVLLAGGMQPVRRFALVIGSNATLDPTQTELRFADDDAARVAELLSEVGVDVELVTSFDQPSQRLHPDLVAAATAPTEKGVEEAWERLRERIDEAGASAETDLIIYYSGHGDVGPDGQGYLTLEGGKLTRNRLFSKLLSGSTATHNHVLIDACESEQFVLTRGKNKKWKNDRVAGDSAAGVRRYLDKNHLGAFPNTGVIIAHSADQQTHEWERYQGGIFSHQLLSGLRGGADLNGDGSIEYSELGAFVAAANSGVKDPRARLEVVVRPPKNDERRAVLHHDDLSQQRVLYFPEGDVRRYSVEDARGVRIADLRRTGDQPGYVRLPEGEVFITRHDNSEGGQTEDSFVSADQTGVLMVPDLVFNRSARASRGALDQAFRAGLFSTGFGPGYYNGYTDQQGLLGVREAQWHEDLWATTQNPAVVADAPAEEPKPTAAPPAESERRSRGETWGGIFFGTVITPLNPGGSIELDPERVTSNQFRACLSPSPDGSSGCSAVRGFDLRWQVFHLREGKKYPRLLGYFRTGYTAGYADFTTPDGLEFGTGAAKSLSYVTVPLFFGGNFYVFDDFPVRPYGGVGVGLDVLRVEYERENQSNTTDVNAQVGFEIHAGVEGRITNRVALTAEVMQLWSLRRKIAGVPDFSNEGFTIIMGVAVGFPLRRDTKRRRATTTRASKSPPPAPSAPPAPPKSPESQQR